MTWTLDRSTDVGKVRVLVTGESVESSAVFSDEDLDVFLDLEDSVLGAAAMALERIAADQALLFRKLKVGSIELDGPAVASSFLALAARYRAVDDQNDDGGPLIVETVYDELSAAQAIYDGWLRSLT